MAQLESRLSEITAADAQVALIAAEKREGFWRPAKFFETHSVSSPFLLDEDRMVARDYGLHQPFGKDGINIARPATLVIDRERWVRYIYRGDSQHDRAPVDEVLKALQDVGK